MICKVYMNLGVLHKWIIIIIFVLNMDFIVGSKCLACRFEGLHVVYNKGYLTLSSIFYLSVQFVYFLMLLGWIVGHVLAKKICLPRALTSFQKVPRESVTYVLECDMFSLCVRIGFLVEKLGHKLLKN